MSETNGSSNCNSICRCCRHEKFADDPSDTELCSSCRAWNSVRELMRCSVPAWQIHIQRDQQVMLEEADDWLDGQGEQISELLPSEPAWAALLRAVSGQSHIRLDETEPDLDNEYGLSELRQLLAQRNSPLFPKERNPDSEPEDREMCMRLAGHELVTDRRSLRVDGVNIEGGPGELLLRLLFENNREQATARFLRMLGHIEGTQSEDGEDLESHRRRGALRSCRFHIVGAADAPRPAADLAGFVSETPPLCDWDSQRWLLGIDDGNGSRLLLPLPRTPTLVERFLSIWSGRPNRRVSNRLRAICLRWTQRSGTIAPNACITPHERSFSMLRGVVEANLDRVRLLEDGMMVTGTMGVRWSITKGRGVHNTPYVIRPVCMRDDERRGRSVCLFDNSEHLPLGDRLVATVLGLLNDETVAKSIPQVAFAVAQLNPHLQVRGLHPALEQIMQQLVHIAED